MRKRVLLLAMMASVAIASFSQNDAREEYEKFRRQMMGKYDDFRSEANRKYADFLRQAWEEYKKKPAMPKPEDEKRPPVVMPDKDKGKPVEDKPVIIEGVVTPPAPQPQPKPVAPIREQPQPEDRVLNFSFYNTECKVRFPDKVAFSLGKCDKNALADAWEKLSESDYNNTIRDCLELRDKLQLCDWAYINMLKTMSETCLGKTNEAALLAAYVYCQSGYDMRLGVTGGNVCLLYASRHVIYDIEYYSVDGKQYYPFTKSDGAMYICDASFPDEKPLDLSIPRAMSLTYATTTERTIQSKRYPDMRATVSTNRNLIDFYNTYPSSMTDNDFMTRWAFYANTPMEVNTKEKLYGDIKPKLEGLGTKEAVEKLLNFVQTGFVYEFDDKVWGCDRAFFAEETLFYPYCDCEDRSILFSRLVRDLLGLKVVLVYYPGHLATAVRFDEDVNGDYLTVGGYKYVVCDPTYIGAPVGRTMPDMDNKSAKVILLN